jgi:hypothetical protein
VPGGVEDVQVLVFCTGFLAAERLALLDERHMPPGVGAEALGVVVGHAGQFEAVLGDGVPLLAGHLARLAADAHGGVGEEAHARRGVRIPGRPRHVGFRTEQQVAAHRVLVRSADLRGAALGHARTSLSLMRRRRPAGTYHRDPVPVSLGARQFHRPAEVPLLRASLTRYPWGRRRISSPCARG